MFNVAKKDLEKSMAKTKMKLYFLLRLEERVKTFKKTFKIPAPAVKVSDALIQDPVSPPMYRLKLKVSSKQEQFEVLTALNETFAANSTAWTKFKTANYRNATVFHHSEYGSVFTATLPELAGDNTHERLIYVGVSDKCESRKFFNVDGSFKVAPESKAVAPEAAPELPLSN